MQDNFVNLCFDLAAGTTTAAIGALLEDFRRNARIARKNRLDVAQSVAQRPFQKVMPMQDQMLPASFWEKPTTVFIWSPNAVILRFRWSEQSD